MIGNCLNELLTNLISLSSVYFILLKDKRTRKCSIVREEDEEESSHELSSDGNELKVAVTRRESISDGRLNRSVQEKCSNIVSSSSTASNKTSGGGGRGGGVADADDTDAVMDTPTKMVVSVDAALAQKLKQIDKDTTDDDVVSCLTVVRKPPPPSSPDNSENNTEKSSEMEDTLRGLKELEIGKLKHLPGNTHKNPVLTHRRHSKLNKIRTPSCSSSEASDDDTKSRNKKKIHKLGGDTPTRFRMHRRDSHDDSSDSQDQGFPTTGGTHGGHDLITTTNVNNKRESQNHQVSEIGGIEEKIRTIGNYIFHVGKKRSSLEFLLSVVHYKWETYTSRVEMSSFVI